MSEKRKGIRLKCTKLNEDIIRSIRFDFDNEINIDDHNIGKKLANGRVLTYKQAFIKKYAKKYNVSLPCIKHIIDRISWKNVI